MLTVPALKITEAIKDAPIWKHQNFSKNYNFWISVRIRSPTGDGAFCKAQGC